MELSFEEMVLIHNALNEILNGPSAISRWEFQTRTGVEFEEAEKLMARISKAIEDRRAH